jgi:hypothetical protein
MKHIDICLHFIQSLTFTTSLELKTLQISSQNHWIKQSIKNGFSDST